MPVGWPGGRPTQAPSRLCSIKCLIMSVGRPGGRPSGRPSYPVHVCAHRSTGRSTSPYFVDTGRPAPALWTPVDRPCYWSDINSVLATEGFRSPPYNSSLSLHFSCLYMISNLITLSKSCMILQLRAFINSWFVSVMIQLSPLPVNVDFISVGLSLL